MSKSNPGNRHVRPQTNSPAPATGPPTAIQVAQADAAEADQYRGLCEQLEKEASKLLDLCDEDGTDGAFAAAQERWSDSVQRFQLAQRALVTKIERLADVLDPDRRVEPVSLVVG